MLVLTFYAPKSQYDNECQAIIAKGENVCLGFSQGIQPVTPGVPQIGDRPVSCGLYLLGTSFNATHNSQTS